MTNRPTEHTERSSRSTKPTSFLREPQEDDRWLRFWSTMDRFGWDVLAVLLFLWSLLSLFGLSGLTEGTWIGYWTHILQTGFGWGSIFVIIFLAFLGFLALRRHFPSLPEFALSRTLSLELLALVLVALFSLFDGLNMADAEAGSAGGVVGWGLATLFSRIIPVPFITILLVILGIILAANGFGLMGLLTRILEGWPGRNPRRLNLLQRNSSQRKTSRARKATTQAIGTQIKTRRASGTFAGADGSLQGAARLGARRPLAAA